MSFWPMRKKHLSTFNSKRLSLRISEGKCSAFFFVFLCSVVNSFVTKRWKIKRGSYVSNKIFISRKSSSSTMREAFRNISQKDVGVLFGKTLGWIQNTHGLFIWKMFVIFSLHKNMPSNWTKIRNRIYCHFFERKVFSRESKENAAAVPLL